ncbi:MAG: PDZ domain-containing protein, partial [Vulcanimicrobiaceae bacterium]
LSRAPAAADAQKLGINLLLRLHTWMTSQPAIANTLFSRGLAYEPKSEKPAYFYRLFKTSDGNLRAYVRPGGPAYDAGLRTNDIVEKIDGRWWWEYGTYPSERLPYDGKTHDFELKRGKQSLIVRLGEAPKGLTGVAL